MSYEKKYKITNYKWNYEELLLINSIIQNFYILTKKRLIINLEIKEWRYETRYHLKLIIENTTYHNESTSYYKTIDIIKTIESTLRLIKKYENDR